MAVERQPTGVRGFDIVLNGRLVPNRSYVLHGEAGTGITNRSHPDDDLSVVDDGRIELQHTERTRTLTVPKFPKSARNGLHGMRISDDGIAVFPALSPKVHDRDFNPVSLSSGIPQVDQLLNGGIDRGTVTVISGPTGVGKTTFGTQFMKEAAGRGQRSIIYMFEETTETFHARSKAINVPVAEMDGEGMLNLVEVEPIERSAVEFVDVVRRVVESNETDIVMLDGIEGGHSRSAMSDRTSSSGCRRSVEISKTKVSRSSSFRNTTR